jgi:hypothetical protein
MRHSLRWPGTIGSDGCVRSNAYTEDFSSMQSTTALSGVAGRINHSTKRLSINCETPLGPVTPVTSESA